MFKRFGLRVLGWESRGLGDLGVERLGFWMLAWGFRLWGLGSCVYGSPQALGLGVLVRIPHGIPDDTEGCALRVQKGRILNRLR